MKRSSIISAVILSAFLLCSCGEAENTSVQTPSQNTETCDLEPLFEYDEDILKSGILGHYKEEIGYDELIGSAAFQSYFSDYTEKYPDAYAAKPFKTAVVSYEGKEVYELNMWRVPVMDGDNCVGIITIDCRDGQPTADSYFASSYLTGVQAAMEGKMVLFTCGCTTYGMYEDGSIVITGQDRDTEYKGTLSFEQLNMGYNVVSPETLKEVVYSTEKK